MFHFIWVQKSDIREPLLWSAFLGILLVLRVPAIKQRAASRRRQLASQLSRNAQMAAKTGQNS
jgi:hypothetical protein